MGYISRVTLHRVDATQPNFQPRWESLTDEQLGALKAQSEHADYCIYLRDDGGYEMESGKWYTLDEDLAALSLAYPGQQFLADCTDAAGHDDPWRVWATGGKHCRTEPYLAWPEPTLWA